MQYETLYRQWLDKATADPDLRGELLSIEGDTAAIADRFYRELDFGTGGLRGVIGAGTNRANVYTLSRTTQGICAYLRRNFQQPSMAIGYDSRNKSDLFARVVATVFAANGVRVFLYPHLMPTPALSYAVRALSCSGGVMITASHNPARYNGYKVYGPDGCQIGGEAADEISAEIGAVDTFEGVQYVDFDEAVRRGDIATIGEAVREAYLAAVATQSLIGTHVPRDVSIVYTPLNGAGISCVPDCLAQNGFTDITIPEAQRNPDGNFPTCPYPNPEIREALQVGLDCAQEIGADLLLATDPDCDRVGIAVRDGAEYTLLSGNQVGALLLDFICTLRRENNTLPDRPVAVKTIVTTPLTEKICARHGVQVRKVLTGFKYIGEQIALLEQDGEADRYILGFEESYGYLSGTFVRDKDAVNASLLICEMFAYHRAQGRSLIDALNVLYVKHGAFAEAVESFEFEGADGFARMQAIMAGLREDAPAEIAGAAVLSRMDYLDTATTSLPRADVLQFSLADGAQVIIRPSGTEPKLKTYFFVEGATMAEGQASVARLRRYWEAVVKG